VLEALAGGGEGDEVMRSDYHPDWNEMAFTLCDAVMKRYGGSIYDPRCGKCWDPGQAMCAEIYGPGWNDDPQFLRDTEIESDQPCPKHMLEGARRLAYGKSEWATPLEAVLGD